MFSDPITSVAYVLLREFLPGFTEIIRGKKSGQAAKVVLTAAKRITGERRFQDMFRKLSEEPELLVQFQKEILDFEKKLQESHTQDLQGARMRDMILAQTGKGNLRADIMVCAAAVGLVSCLGALALFRGSLSGECVGIISTIAGIFGACLKDAYAFEFGSSRGSKEKDRQVSAFLEQRSHYDSF